MPAKKPYTFLVAVSFLLLNLVLSAQEAKDMYLDSLLRQGIEDTQEARYQEAMQALTEVLETAGDEKNSRYEFLATLNLGVLYRELNESEEALNYFFQARDIAIESKQNILINSAYNNIAVWYSENEDYTKAVEIFTKALEISTRNEMQRSSAINHFNIGNALKNLDKLEEASENYEMALEIFSELNMQEHIAFCYISIGSINSLKGQYDQAIEYFKLATEAIDDEESVYMANTFYSLGEAYSGLEKYDSAIINFKNSLRISEKHRLKELIVGCNESIASSYASLERSADAIPYYERAKIYKDSLLEEKNRIWVSEMEMRYDFGKKVLEVEYLEKRNKLVLILWILSSAVILATGISIFFFMRSRTQKIRQRNELLKKEKEVKQLELEKKDRELASNAIFTSSKNDLLKQIDAQFHGADPDNSDDMLSRVKNLRSIIKSNLRLEEDWKDIKMHFDNVHPKFFSRLLEEHPSLTQADTRMCAYIILDLNPKEIAQLLAISPESVRKRNQRLREKMGLDTQVNLREYLARYR